MAYSLKHKGNIFTDLDRMLTFSRPTLETFVRQAAGEAFMINRTNWSLNAKVVKEGNLFIRSYLDRLNDFFSSLKKGYVKAFAKAEYKVDVKSGKVSRIK